MDHFFAPLGPILVFLATSIFLSILGANWEIEKVRLTNDLEKDTFRGWKNMISEWKNIPNTMEDWSKSDFSHIRNKVEKVTLRPPVLERFLDLKSPLDREKVVSKSLQKITWFLIRFCSDVRSLDLEKS